MRRFNQRQSGFRRLGACVAPVMGGWAILLLAASGCNVPRWDFEYGFGRQRATDEKKAMLLYFTDLMAGPHYEFDKHVLQQPVVQRELLQTVNVALSHQWGPAPKQFNILKPEVCIMCRPDGSEMARVEVNPAPTAEAFAAWLREQRAKAAPPPTAPAKATDQPLR